MTARLALWLALAGIVALAGCQASIRTASSPTTSAAASKVERPEAERPTASPAPIPLTVEQILACNRRAEVYDPHANDSAKRERIPGPSVASLPDGTVFYGNHVNSYDDGNIYVCGSCEAALRPVNPDPEYPFELPLRFRKVDGGAQVDCSYPPTIMPEHRPPNMDVDIPVVGQFLSKARKP